MEKAKVLYHGSRKKIDGFIEPRQANDTSNKDNCQLGVYATDRFIVAQSMALKGASPGFSNLSEEDHKIVFMHLGPKPDEAVYVYEMPADTFEETSEEHQFISKVKVPILRTYVFRAIELKNRWRLADEEEFNLKWKKFGYPKPYKEFFMGKSYSINQK